jgi:peptidoglycan/xylan/chitin deacetylase (PgdA/CDA1 family)
MTPMVGFARAYLTTNKLNIVTFDGKFHMVPGFVGSDMYEKYLIATFDMLHREACNGRPRMMNIPMHSRIVGKPGRAEALRNFMLHISKKKGVWIATRRDIA